MEIPQWAFGLLTSFIFFSSGIIAFFLRKLISRIEKMEEKINKLELVIQSRCATIKDMDELEDRLNKIDILHASMGMLKKD